MKNSDGRTPPRYRADSGANGAGGMRSPFDFTITTPGFPPPTIAERGALPAGVTFIDNG
jgi:hypothetical protein